MPSPLDFHTFRRLWKGIIFPEKKFWFNKSSVNHLKKLLHHVREKNYAPTNTYVLSGFFLSHIIKYILTYKSTKYKDWFEYWTLNQIINDYLVTYFHMTSRLKRFLEGCYPSAIYSCSIEPLCVLHSRFPTKDREW